MMLDNEEIYNYCEKTTDPHSSLLADLYRESNLKTLNPNMVSGPLQGRLLSLISKMISPDLIVEIGTFTGYATLCLAEGLTEEGKIKTIEINEELKFISEKYFALSEYNDKIVPLYGDAKEVIKELEGGIDLVFIDAKKRDYPIYYDLILDKVKKGGFILADNVLWKGKVLQEKKDKTTQVIHDFNFQVLNDDRVENMMLPLRDGINIIRKK